MANGNFRILSHVYLLIYKQVKKFECRKNKYLHIYTLGNDISEEKLQ